MSRRKTLADFPRFTVTSLRKEPPNAEGYTNFEIAGTFDRVIERSKINWFWLLVGEQDCLCVEWKSQDDATLSAVLVGSEKSVPEVVGATLYYLSPRWNASNVWMILDSQWGWDRVKFETVDAVADVAIVNRREVTQWTTLERADNKGHTTRYLPANDESQALPRVILGGWKHEDCTLCHAHIDPGQLGYRDRDDRWMCENCYEKYVRPRDLAFVDDL